MNFLPFLLLCAALSSGDEKNDGASNTKASADSTLHPVVVTDTVTYDTDDPAIWINPRDINKSLIVGTDKDAKGGLFVFDLQGKIQPQSVGGLQRPNNVDIEYGLMLNGKPVDIAVTTERITHKLRIFSLPDMKPVDNGGIDVFENETLPGYRDLMGIGLYKNKQGKVYAFVGRKTGPTAGGYIWQYLLEDNGQGAVKATLVRKFGKYSGKKEIESILVDDKAGYVYYSDEGVGVRQYFADADKGTKELALFATTGFSEDHEGISLYALTDSTGYLLVSDQGANKFHIFSREGTKTNPYQHTQIKVVQVEAVQSDGSETTSVPMGALFPHGMFIAMSDNKTFHFYRWEDIAGKQLKVK